MTKLTDDTKLQRAVKENPCREGSSRYELFQAIKSGTPVKKVLEQGFKRTDLNHLLSKGYIEARNGKAA